jgi:HlyD family secretion protein
MKRWYYIVLAVFCIVIATWFFIPRGTARNTETDFTPQIEKVFRGDIKVEVSATGVIEPINKVEIKSKASGLIEEMSIEEADIVKKGDLISRLDQRDTKNAYDQALADLQVAEATVKQSESDYGRKKELFDKGLISVSDFDLARLALVEAQAQVIRAKINVSNNDIKLKDTVVRSPIDGVILTKDVEVGQIISSGISSVSGGTLIATVADMQEVYVKADVDEVDIGKIAAHMRARATADAFPNEVFEGEVIRIAAQAKVQQNVTTFEVTIKVKNPLGKLKAGMNASVEILVTDKQNVLLVPNEALMSENNLEQELQKIEFALNPQKKVNEQKSESEFAQRDEHRAPQESASQGTKADRTESTHGTNWQNSDESTKWNSSTSSTAEEKLGRGVIVKDGNDFRIQMVKLGPNNYDYTEVIDGLKDGDEVAYIFISRAKQSSEQFMERMRTMSSTQSGFRSTPANR